MFGECLVVEFLGAFEEFGVAGSVLVANFLVVEGFSGVVEVFLVAGDGLVALVEALEGFFAEVDSVFEAFGFVRVIREVVFDSVCDGNGWIKGVLG